MQHIYTVTGMTCNNCKTLVEKKLNALKNVNKVSVNLETQEVTIYSEKLIPLMIIQTALPEKYQVAEGEIKLKTTSKQTDLQQLFPLLLIFIFITGASVLLNYKPWSPLEFMLDFMGIFYVVFSFFKFLDLKGFSESFKMYDPLAKLVPAYGWIYPFIELTLGILFLMRIHIPFALITTLIILGITTFGVTKALLDKKEIKCACLGTVLKLPMTKATFIENTIMIIMAIIMLFNIYN